MIAADQTPGPDATSIGYATLITVGNLLVVVLAMDSDLDSDFSAELAPALAFRLVWPAARKRVRWPDGLILNDTGIATFWPPVQGALVTRHG